MLNQNNAAILFCDWGKEAEAYHHESLACVSWMEMNGRKNPRDAPHVQQREDSSAKFMTMEGLLVTFSFHAESKSQRLKMVVWHH